MTFREDPDTRGAVEPEELLDCIDCGGRAHLLTPAGEWGWQEGDLAVYRCEDCLDRWDVIVGEAGDAD